MMQCRILWDREIFRQAREAAAVMPLDLRLCRLGAKPQTSRPR